MESKKNKFYSIEIEKDKLYWISNSEPPKSESKDLFFSIDEVFDECQKIILEYRRRH